VGQPFVTSTEIIAAARKNLGSRAWERLEGGAETETTVARNRLGFDTLAFRPRALVDVTTIDTSTTFLGHRLRIPVMTAPIGSSHLFAKDGHHAVARAAETFGTVPILSSMAVGTTWEEVADATGGPKVLQLSMSGDLEWARDAIARAKRVGYTALCLAFDSPRFGRLERELQTSRESPRLTPPLRTGMSWSILPRLLEGAGLPLIAKGITHPDDARRLTDYGFEVIYVSNHGGHTLDHARGAIDNLPDVVATVAGRAQVILDSGVMRGTDVVKALALGASAVAIGRLQCFGLGAGGELGLVRLLEILEEEIFYTMTFLGAPTIADIARDHVVTDALPVTTPSLLSAFPLLAE
jgi:glycolate oxidase